MNRSALNAEVEYHLRSQKLELQRQQVVEEAAREPGVIARVLAFLGREQRRTHITARRGREAEAEPQFRERFVG